jgi:hypothetical protein
VCVCERERTVNSSVSGCSQRKATRTHTNTYSLTVWLCHHVGGQCESREVFDVFVSVVDDLREVFAFLLDELFANLDM